MPAGVPSGLSVCYAFNFSNTGLNYPIPVLQVHLEYYRRADCGDTGGPRNLEARLQLAAHNVTDGDYEAAIEQLIGIVRIDRSYREDVARKSLVSLFELLVD